ARPARLVRGERGGAPGPRRRLMSVRFRLARVLGLRTRLREQAQDTVQESAAALAAAGERIDAARAVQDSVRAAEDASAATGIRGADLARSRAYEASLALEEAALVVAQARLAEDLERCRAVLIERRRGQELDEREQAVKARAAAVDALEKTVAEEVARLEALVGGKGAPATEAAAPAAAGVAADITKIYESMKAEEAAPILDRLDDA